MNNLRHWAIGTLLLAMVASAGFAQRARTGSARAGGAGAAVSPLKDLPGVEVRVSAGEEQRRMLRGLDVTEENLESQVEHALGRAKIPVLTEAESRAARGRPLLQLYLHVAPLETAENQPMGYIAHAGIELRENAVSSRTRRAVDASVWGYDVVGGAVDPSRSEGLDRRSRDMIEDLVDRAVQAFVDAYRDGNR